MPITRFHLVGVQAGQTVLLGAKTPDVGPQYPFVDGVFEFAGSDQDAVNIGVFLERSYQAYPEGPKLDAARLAFGESGEASKPAKTDSKKVEPTKDDGVEPRPESVAEALSMLDASNDSHWNSRKQPSVDALVALLGRTVTRAEIEEAAPGFDRDAAKA